MDKRSGIGLPPEKWASCPAFPGKKPEIDQHILR